MKATRTCSVGGCEARVKSRGWCNSHYERWRLTGDVGADRPIGHFHPERDGCSVEGCGRPYLAVGFCALHWKRNDIWGDPNYVTPLGFKVNANAWKGKGVTYAGAHRRLLRYRGLATVYACVRCGGPAHQWSYDHADPDERFGTVGGYVIPYSADPDHYRPMCRSCHKRFDLEPR